MRRVADPGEFSYIRLLLHLFSLPFKKLSDSPEKSTLHNAASQYTIHCLNTVNNSAIIHVLVG